MEMGRFTRFFVEEIIWKTKTFWYLKEKYEGQMLDEQGIRYGTTSSIINRSFDKALHTFLFITASLVVGLGVAGTAVYKSQPKYIKPTPIQKNAENAQKQYSSTDALQLFCDMSSSSLLDNKTNEYIKDYNDEKIIKVKNEVTDYLKRLNENNAQLKAEYEQFYGFSQKTPKVVSKILYNQMGYKRTKNGLEFVNRYKTDDAYLDLAKFKSKSQEESPLLKEPSAKDKISVLCENVDVQKLPELLDEFVGKLSPELGTEEMRLGLLMESANRDVLNTILTNCTEMNIDVIKYVQQNQEKREREVIVTIDSVNYIMPKESAQTIDGPELGM